ncbi:MAG TPA: DUF4375 domain-containing protein [Haloferula sp.]
MAERVPCRECGAEILPATAEATGGVCMACKKGFRKDIESSKQFYAEQRKYDPVRELWLSLVRRVSKTEQGFNGLSRDERLYFAVSCLNGEIYNGGFHQFFAGNAGEFYAVVVDGLTELGATHSLVLLREAADLLFDGPVPPADLNARWDAMKHYPEDPSAPVLPWMDDLERINEGFCEDPDQLSDRLLAFAKESGLVAPFEKDPGEGA